MSDTKRNIHLNIKLIEIDGGDDVIDIRSTSDFYETKNLKY